MITMKNSFILSTVLGMLLTASGDIPAVLSEEITSQKDQQKLAEVNFNSSLSNNDTKNKDTKNKDTKNISNAAEISDSENDDSGMDQITSVSQLKDVQTTDWAFQALQSLVERYGCIAGYPDGKFQGNRAMNRYEFAAGLNACMDKISQLINNGSSNNLKKEDLITLQKLQESFAAELATIRGRTDTLEARTTELEANEFTESSTFFGGEVTFGLSKAFGAASGTTDGNAVFHQVMRLQTVTSFTGKDRLRIELGTGDFNNRGFANRDILNTDMSLMSFQNGSNNQIQLNKIEYRFPAFGDRVVFTIKPVGFSLGTILTANSPYFDSGQGAISRFAEASPIFKIGKQDAGVGLDWLVSDKIRLQLAYGTRDGYNTNKGQGFLGSNHSVIGAQVLVKPSANILTGITYANTYSNDGRLDTFTGSFNADTSGGLGQPANIQALGGTLQWRLAPKLVFGTWGGVFLTDYIKSNASATSTTYLFSLGLADPFNRRGDLVAFLFGQPPKLIDGNKVREDKDTSFHFETFYRFTVTDNISITPGFFVITNPDHNAKNDTIVIGTIRTNFRF